MVNRFDTGLLVLPALAVEIWRTGWRAAVVPVVVGMLPLAAWEVFSIVYYGFPFPNTAYSKLKTGVPAPEIHYQGFLYLLDSIANDPLTLLVVATAILGPIAFGGGWSIPIGVFVYLVYVVRVGGDFMSGRFLTAPFLLSVLWLSRARIGEFRGAWAFAAAAVAVVGLSAPRPTILSNASYGSDIEPARVIAPTGITDERRYYYPQSGLLTALRGVPMPNHRWTHMGHDLTNRGETFFSTDAAGFIGYAAGPSVTFLDRYGLGDPLIARLPAEAPWRIGHFVREVPDGYAETLRTGRDHIRDSGVAVYYDKLQIITEGHLFTAERWHTILRMNLGRYERYIADYGLRRVRWEDVAAIKSDRTDWNLPENVRLSLRGVEVSLPQGSRGRIELSVSRNDTYTVVFLNNGRAVGERRLRQRMQADSSLLTHTVELPPDVVFDAVRVQPSAGDARYALGHLRLVP
jgi:arabinofuranosyltransferase